jgi:hypothetical protein
MDRIRMEHPVFTKACLSDVRVIMMIKLVPVVELLCQTVTGWIPVLKILLSDVCGCLWPCPIMPDCRSVMTLPPAPLLE